MKHTYSGTELRGGGKTPENGMPGGKAPRPDGDGSGKAARWFVRILLLLAVAAALALLAAGVWAWSGRESGARGFAPWWEAGEETAEGYLKTSEGQMKQLYEFVKNSAYVQGNAHYREVAGKVSFRYDGTRDEVNAYSRARKSWMRPEGQEVLCLGGAARFARLISLGWAAELGGREGAAQGLLEAMTPGQFGALTEREAAALLRQARLEEELRNGPVRARAESIASGMLSFVLAHELGHQALGHVFGEAGNNEVSRNQEREADSFASNVLATSAFGEYMFAGEMFWQYAQATQQAGDAAPGTHPEARERMENLAREHPELAKAFGI